MKSESAAKKHYRKQFPNCVIETGERLNYRTKKTLEHTYLVVPPKTAEGVTKYFWLNADFTIKKEICGRTKGYGKQANWKCHNNPGKRTDHPGVGACWKHKKKRTVEDKAVRVLYSEVLQVEGRVSPFVNLLNALEAYPEDKLLNLEGEISLLRSIAASMLKRKLDLGLEPADLNAEFYRSYLGVMRQLDSMARTHYTIQKDASFTPRDIDRWLDEARTEIAGKMGAELAEKFFYYMMTVRGLLDRATLAGLELPGPTTPARIRDAYPLGYAQVVED